MKTNNDCNNKLNISLQKLQAREQSINQLEKLSSLGSWELDIATGKTIWSDNLYDIYGVDPKVDTPTQELFIDLLIPKYVEILNNSIAEGIATKKITKTHAQAKRKNDGKIIDVLISGKIIFDNNIPTTIIGSTQDITQQLEIKRHSDELADLIKYSSNEIYIIEKDTYKYVYANQGAVDALGYSYDELLNMNVLDTNPNLTKEEAKRISDISLKNNFSINRSTHQRKDGSTYNVQAYIHPLRYNDKDTFVLFDTDISEIVKLEDKLQYQVNHDNLTKLPNRALFKDRLTQALKASARNKEKFALLFIDLDKFKQINDSLGHNMGDNVLIEASLRLEASIRDDDTLARIGGDEFVVILRNITDSNSSATVAKKIVESMSQEMEIDNHSLFISASVGIAQCPMDSTNESSLVKFADIAMYKAKEKRDGFIFYHDLD